MELYTRVQVDLFTLCDTSEQFRALVRSMTEAEIRSEFGITADSAEQLARYVATFCAVADRY